MNMAGTPTDLEATPLAAVMTPDWVTLPVDSSIAYALNLMVLESVRHIPMVDDEGRSIAVVSMRNGRDLLTIAPHPHLARFRNREGA